MKKILNRVTFISVMQNLIYTVSYAQSQTNADFSQIDNFVKNKSNENSNIFSDIINNGMDFNFKNYFVNFFMLFKSSFAENIKMMYTIGVIAVLAYFYESIMIDKKENKNDAVKIFLCSLLAACCLYTVNICLEKTYTCLCDVFDFMKISLPVYIGAVSVTGNLMSALYESLLMVFNNILYSVLIKFVIPVVFAISVLNILSTVFDLNFGKYTYKTAFGGIKSLITVMLAIFAGILSLTSMSAANAAFPGINAVKFVLGKFVPVAGGYLSDTVTAIATAASAIKGSVGIAGIAALLIIVSSPVIQIGASVAALKIASIILSPLFSEQSSDILKTACDAAEIYFVIILCVTAAFTVSVAIVMSGISLLGNFI